MAITLNSLDPNSPISQGPSTINGNFELVKQHIDDIESILDINANIINLTNFVVPADSIGSSSVVLFANYGFALSVKPNNGVAVATIDVTGIYTGLKFVATGTSTTDKSTFGYADFSGDVIMGSKISINELDLLQNNSIIKKKLTTKTITDANCGASATNPISLAGEIIVLLDYYNGGSALNNVDVKIDITTLKEGQIVKFIMGRSNSAGMKLNNGSVNNEIFARIDTTLGMQSISSTVQPTFSPQASPDSLSYLEVRWTNIGGGAMRLLVLDSKNIDNVG
jgi:hypothetical protein